MINDDGEVAMVSLVRDLVDADAPQPIQPIAKGFDVGPHPGDDRPDGAPSDAHQLGHRALRTLRYQPGHGLIEGQRVPGAVPRPRHMRHDHAVLGAADPRRVCLHEHTDRARIAPASDVQVTVDNARSSATYRVGNRCALGEGVSDRIILPCIWLGTGDVPGIVAADQVYLSVGAIVA